MRRSLLLAPLALAAVLLARPAEAQEFPTRAVTMVIPYAPGGSTDVLGRIVARGMGKALGQPVVVENQGGAGGNIGTQRVVRAAPDGYTLTFGNLGPLAANVQLYPNLGYDPRRDLAPIGVAASNPMVLAVSPRIEVRDLAGLLGHLRAEDGNVPFGNAGPGSTSHLAASLFLQLSGTRATLVGYRGVGPVLTDLAAGVVEVLIDQTLTLIPAHRGGTARALAVATPQRLPQLPDVPTFAEAGVPGFDMQVWNALLAPAGTPAPVIARLVAALNAGLDDPEAKQRLEELAAVVPQGEARGPEALRRLIASEVDRWSGLIRDASIRVE
ncbi:tripartite tricarboxylate transporter substrate binding protein [Roseomonas sp. NAR14]|uniref:Tripartite tricarboxylate transporter substrate binding protein n=1 Tax=Roseomonas acroporae TaxID=2937791 RepID=A0A9X2BUW6_9PROT|nr:tripartite tricarboxylate transporter substrate binding protein [Roseomonas acroporae]MCK8784511.1 tripartite tricarboxylate transporter substrate binding protein [Roseomonas acroporae]